MSSLSRVRLLVCVLAFGAVSTASIYAAPVSQEDLTAQKELIQIKLDSLSALQQKDVDGFRLRLEALDKRLDDQLTQSGQGVDRLGVYASLLGMLVTVILAALGVIGYVTVARRTKQEAQNAAKQWFDEKSQNLKQTIVALEDQAKKSFSQHEKDVDAHAAEAKARLSARGLENTPTSNGDDSQRASDVNVVRASADELTKKPEESYSFDDWDMRAFAASGDNKLNDAVYFWSRAAEVPNAGALKVSRALLNKGITQGQLQQYKEAIATYEEVLRRFGDASELALHALVGRALVSNGTAQGLLGQYEAAIQAFAEVLRRFGDASESALRELVRKASNGIGFCRLCQAKQVWSTDQTLAKQLLDAAGKATEQAIESPSVNGVFLGNRAYTRYLQGDVAGAEVDFRNALAAKDDGGESLYQATLKDLDIHPIPEDAGMRALVERLWQQWSDGRGAGTP